MTVSKELSRGPQRLIHLDDIGWQAPDSGGLERPTGVELQVVTPAECDLAVLVFRFPPNHLSPVHWHPADTVYVVRSGEFIVDGEGSFHPGDMRWVKAGTVYGPERSGGDGCEVMLIASGTYPLPIYDPQVSPPLEKPTP
jgi:hypothetical protein